MPALSTGRTLHMTEDRKDAETRSDKDLDAARGAGPIISRVEDPTQQKLHSSDFYANKGGKVIAAMGNSGNVIATMGNPAAEVPATHSDA